MADLKIVPYSDEHHAGVLSLQRRLWGGSLELNQAYFRWKYVENPHAEFGRILLAVSAGRLVGMRGFMGAVWRRPDGGSMPIPLAGDTVVAEEFEGRGIVNRLSKAARKDFADQGIRLILSASASPVPMLLSLRSGWKLVGHYSRIRSLSHRYVIAKMAENLHRFTPLKGSASRDPLLAKDGWSRTIKGDMRVSLSRSPDPEALAELCARTAKPAKYSLLRNADFFRWRFSNPFFNYYFLTCHKQGSLVAYLCLRVEEREFGYDVRVVDWNHSEWPHLVFLLRTLKRSFSGVSVSMQDNALTPAERQDLRRIGYRDIAYRGSRVARRLNVKPGLMVIATEGGEMKDDPVADLVAAGFDLIEYKGIESDGS